VYGISLFLSVIFVKVRDLTNVMELFFQLLFWGSAIFYKLSDLNGNTGAVINANPIAILIDAARRGFVKNEITHVNAVLIYTVAILILIACGRWFFDRNIRKIAEYF